MRYALNTPTLKNENLNKESDHTTPLFHRLDVGGKNFNEK